MEKTQQSTTLTQQSNKIDTLTTNNHNHRQRQLTTIDKEQRNLLVTNNNNIDQQRLTTSTIHDQQQTINDRRQRTTTTINNNDQQRNRQRPTTNKPTTTIDDKQHPRSTIHNQQQQQQQRLTTAKTTTNKNKMSVETIALPEAVKDKEIFKFLWPEGYNENPLYGNSDHPKATLYYVTCPNDGCGQQLGAPKLTHYCNPISHVATHHIGGRLKLSALVVKAKEEANGDSKKQALLIRAFSLSSPQDEALFTWITLVCVHNIPITKSKDRSFCKLINGGSIGYEMIINTMLELTLIVEGKVAEEIKGKVGVIMHDGWSKLSRHYVCLLAAYLASTGKRDELGEEKLEPVITMLTCTTLPQLDVVPDSETEVAATATSFNADTHIKLFENTFNNLKIKKVKNFAIGQVADSTALNPAIARKLCIQHIACRNHCLNLGCKDMEKKCKERGDIATKTQEIHRKVKASNKLTAELENVQANARALDDSEPQAGFIGKLKLQAATRWNSLVGMLVSHVKAADGLREVIQLHPEKDMTDETTSVLFIRKIEKHLPYLNKLKQASLSMQKRLATLDDCQFQNDLVADCVKKGYKKKNDPWEHCVIEQNKIAVGAYDSNADFIKAVMKVQQCREDLLTDEEADTIELWKLPSDSDSKEVLDDPVEDFDSMIRDRERKKKLMHTMPQRKSAYDPALKYCVLGSAAEVERVWSMAGHVLTEHRASLSPLVFELIMYLKYNSRLWDLADVVNANKNRKDSTQAGKARCGIQAKVDAMKNEMMNWEKTINVID